MSPLQFMWVSIYAFVITVMLIFVSLHHVANANRQHEIDKKLQMILINLERYHGPTIGD